MFQTFAKPIEKELAKPDWYKQGQLFEEYIINLFNKDYFKLKIWREAKNLPTSLLAPDISYPDLEIELVFKGAKQYRFAVECKWRKEFKEGKINWAKFNQIARYRRFQFNTGITVFVAIGVGGVPNQPEKLFLTPLDHIHLYEELYEKNLIPYKRKPTRRFYYDSRQMRLF